MNKYFFIALGLILVILLFNRFKSVLSIDTGKVKEKISGGALVVDVRTPAEYQSGHYPGALNIPVDQLEKRLDEFGQKDKPIIVYCASGGRSGSAKSYLESIGFTDVTNAGGLSNMPK
ncbi:MAG: rhodanese-like domain-containing protein [Leptospira sp.]|nr:rhodanese-like domain-containing protein [Leptospira sp.]